MFVDRTVWEATPAHGRFELLVPGVLLGHPQWLASHHAALTLHGLPLFGVDTTLVDVAAAVRTSKRRSCLHVHMATRAQHALIKDPATDSVSVADACVLTAADHGFDAGVVAMDAAVKRGLTTVPALSTAVAHTAIRYGAGAGPRRLRRRRPEVRVTRRDPHPTHPRRGWPPTSLAGVAQ